MTRALALLLVALAIFLLAAAGCEATHGGGGNRPDMVTKAAVAAPTAPAAPADSSANWIAFRMPRWHARPGSCAPDTSHPLAPGYYRWTLGISTQSPVWRDSVAVNGVAWGRDIGNMAKWLPGAQVHPFMQGYAFAGDSVRVRLKLVSSLSWPFTIWATACTDSCSPCLARLGSFAHN